MDGERASRVRDLVLLHGWGLHAGVWDEIAAGLAPRFRVYAIDLPGHGNSHDPAPPAFEDAADLVATAIPEGAFVCGWSLGGLVAQHLAVTRPGHIAKLVLVSSTPCFVARPGWDTAMLPSTLETFASDLLRDRERTLRDFVQLNARHGSHERATVRALWQRLLQRPAPELPALQASLGWLRDTDLRGVAPRIAMPTLVVHGTRDALAPIATGHWLARTLPHAELVEIEDAAHLPFFTHRERFVAALEHFLG